ncbi:secreted RxLR effector protein 161-like [Rutidosis leptorrhynchoides]|uniref:secreted RxLR effector protein 161-like n=1 Tax=Rutidosis leptorrhynchoides TaxID=125765 RepID=UPI003A98FABF
MGRFMESPKVRHLNALKQIVRYIKGTTDYKLVYRRGGDGKLLEYSDSSHGVDIIDRKGTTGIVFYFSGNLISWNSSKQKTVALSSCEAEFMAATTVACQALWLQSLLAELTRQKAEYGSICVEHVSGEEQQADTLTKALPRIKFIEMRNMIGITDLGIKSQN